MRRPLALVPSQSTLPSLIALKKGTLLSRPHVNTHSKVPDAKCSHPVVSKLLGQSKRLERDSSHSTCAAQS